MKTMAFLMAFSLFALFTSCDKDDDNNNSNSASQLNNTLSASGTWRITYFWDSDHDETNDYSGYSFTFGGNNVLTASHNGSSFPGTWTTGTDDSKVKLVIDFSSPSALEEISDDWQVIEQTSGRVKLTHVSGGNGGTDFLTFEKN